MNWRCLLGHKWVGCRCERCKQVRDRDHDWENCRCRRCGLSRQSDHLWQGCVCRICGRMNHQWKAGVCAVCGERCLHEELTCLWGDAGEPVSAHIAPREVCRICGEDVPRVGRHGAPSQR